MDQMAKLAAVSAYFSQRSMQSDDPMEWWLTIMTKIITQLVSADFKPTPAPSKVPICQELIDTIAFDILRTDLGHIRAVDIANGKQMSCDNLLDVLYGLSVAMGMPEATSNLGSGASRATKRIPSGSNKATSLIDDIPNTRPSKLAMFGRQTEAQSNEDRVEKEVKFDPQLNTVIQAEPSYSKEVKVVKRNLNKVKNKVMANTTDALRVADAYLGASRIQKADLPRLLEQEVAGSVENLSHLLSVVLPSTDIPEALRQTMWKREVGKWRALLQSAIRERKLMDIQTVNDLQNSINELPELVQRELEREQAHISKLDRRSVHRRVSSSIRDRRTHQIKIANFHLEAERNSAAILARRQAQEEKLMTKLLNDAFKLEQDSLREAQRMQKEYDREQRKLKQTKIESKRNYMRDQMDMLTHELKEVQVVAKENAKAERTFKSRLVAEEKENLRQGILQNRQRLKVDGTDMSYRKLDLKKS
eukprot:Partr_v1_DN26596_c2_g1_i1_m3792